MGRLPEVVSTVKRRRAWSVEEKVAILDAAFSKSGSVAAAADAFGVSRSLVYIWRQLVRDGLMPGVAMTDAGVSAFAPVTIQPVTIQPCSTTPMKREPEQAATPPPALPAPSGKLSVNGPGKEAASKDRRRCGIVEVMLANGRSIRVDDGIDPDVLARLVAALDGAGS
jgi:transposase